MFSPVYTNLSISLKTKHVPFTRPSMFKSVVCIHCKFEFKIKTHPDVLETLAVLKGLRVMLCLLFVYTLDLLLLFNIRFVCFSLEKEEDQGHIDFHWIGGSGGKLPRLPFLMIPPDSLVSLLLMGE